MAKQSYQIERIKISKREFKITQLDSFTLQTALIVLGNVLADRRLHFEVVAIGGGGLLL